MFLSLSFLLEFRQMLSCLKNLIFFFLSLSTGITASSKAEWIPTAEKCYEKKHKSKTSNPDWKTEKEVSIDCLFFLLRG